MTVSHAAFHSRGLGGEGFHARNEALRRPPGASVSSGSRAAGLSSAGLQARQDARERPSAFGGPGNYGSNALLRGGEHPADDRDQAVTRVPRPEHLLRHRTDPTHDSGSGGRQFVFPALASGASQSREGADERGAGSAADASLPRRRRGGAGTPPAYPPPPAHLPSPPPPLIPSYHYNGGNGGSGGSGTATHSAAGSRSLPPGRGNRPTTPSQVGGALASRRGAEERAAASGLASGGAGPLGNSAFEGRDALPGRGAPEATSRNRNVSVPAGGSAGSGGGGSSSSTDKCDKCDGKHSTDQCPHFRGDREKHKDAWCNYGRRNGPMQMGGSGGNFVLKSARVVRQPGDGSCLFHSLAHGLNSPSSASGLRREIAGFVQQNPSLEIAGDTLEEWVRWDANSTVAEYARRMAVSGWGGGIEMAACSLLKNVNVHVYESLSRRGGSCSNDFKRISCFDSPNASRTVHVLYQGGVHYDALVPLVGT